MIRLLNDYAWFIYENSWKEQYNTGIEAVKEAIELFPSYASLYDTLAWLCYEKGQVDYAIKAMEKAIEYSSGNTKYLESLRKMKESKK